MAKKNVKPNSTSYYEDLTQTSFRAKESYKMLRTNIRFLTVGEKHPRLVFTSSVSGEGKSTTIINVAVSMREAGYRVLLIDCDLRCPVLHKMANLPIMPGLTNLLCGSATTADIIRPSRYSGLDIVTSGAIPPNPAELLGSKAMADFLAEVEEKYDYILFDTPPATVVSDCLVLSSLVTGYLFVVKENSTEVPDFQKAIDSIELVGGKILGIVLNDVKTTANRKRRNKGYYNYRYNNYYRSYERTHQGASNESAE